MSGNIHGMSGSLRIELTKAERKHLGDVVAYEFSVHDNGAVTIRQCWDSFEEVYSDGYTSHIPARIWATAARWLAEHLPAPLSIGRME